MQPRNKNKITKRVDDSVEIDIEKLSLRGDYVVVVPVTVKPKKGLFKPDQYEDKPEFGRVIKVGSELSDTIKPGQIILFGKWSTVLLTLNGSDYLMLRSEDVIGVVK